MSSIAQELDSQLAKLDPETARLVERIVRGALALAVANERRADVWPEGSFAETSGALAGKQFERLGEGELDKREIWYERWRAVRGRELAQLSVMRDYSQHDGHFYQRITRAHGTLGEQSDGARAHRAHG